MTPEQKTHLEEIVATFEKRVRVKYQRGQAEHGGNLWERPVLRDVIDELTDLNTYLPTLEGQLRQMHTLTQAVREHIQAGKPAAALDLLDQLDAAFRSQLPPS